LSTTSLVAIIVTVAVLLNIIWYYHSRICGS